MASSERKPNYSRRFFWLAVFIVVLFGGYSALWFYAAGKLETIAGAAMAKFGRDGRSAECTNLTVRGYPFRMGLFCDGVRFEDTGRQVAASAAAFRSAAQVYNPFHVVAELDGPASITLPRTGPLSFTWQNLRASTVLAKDLPERASVETDALAAQGSFGDVADTILANIGHAEGHMRRNGADLDLAWSFADAKLNPVLTREITLPPLAGEADLTIIGGTDLRRFNADSLRGRSGTIRTLALSTGDTAGLSVAGPFAFSTEGVLSGDFKVTIRNPKALAAQMAEIFPDKAGQIKAATMGLTALGDSLTLPLKVANGKATLGFIPLGSVPPLPSP